MINVLIAALLSFLIALPNQTAPTKNDISTKSIDPVVKVEQKAIPQEAKSVTKPAKDQTTIEKLDALINTVKTGIAVSERQIEGLSPERAAKSMPALDRKKAELAELERQRAALVAP